MQMNGEWKPAVVKEFKRNGRRAQRIDRYLEQMATSAVAAFLVRHARGWMGQRDGGCC